MNNHLDTLDPQAQALIAPNSLGLMGQHPDAIEPDTIQMGAIEAAFNQAIEHIHEGCRDVKRGEIRWLMETIGERVVQVLNQEVFRRTSDLSHHHPSWIKKIVARLPDSNFQTGLRTIRKLENVKAQIVSLRKALSQALDQSFFAPGEMVPIGVQISVETVHLFEELQRALQTSITFLGQRSRDQFHRLTPIEQLRIDPPIEMRKAFECIRALQSCSLFENETSKLASDLTLVLNFQHITYGNIYAAIDAFQKLAQVCTEAILRRRDAIETYKAQRRREFFEGGVDLIFFEHQAIGLF